MDKYFNSKLIKSFSLLSKPNLGKENTMRYHYTSPEAFLSIIRSKQIRFSDVRFMNDKSEGVFFVKLLLEFMDKNRQRFPFTQSVINIIFPENSFDDIKELRVVDVKCSDIQGFEHKANRNFLLCASEKPDLLNMWNYYIHSSSYEGYSIGFNMEKLLKTFDSQQPGLSDPYTVYYGDILYNEKQQQAEIQSLVEHIEQLGHVAINVRNRFAAEVLRQYLETRSYFFKHKAFEAEKEFRVLISISQDRLHKDKSSWVSSMKNVKESFFSRNGLIVPCLSVNIPENAISRIYLSPPSEEDLTRAGVRELVDVSGFSGIQIHKSKIPIRY